MSVRLSVFTWLLWQTISLRIQDVPEADAWTLDGHSGYQAIGNASVLLDRGKESQLVYLNGQAAQSAISWAATSTPNPFDDLSKLEVTMKVVISGTVDISSVDNLAINFGLEYLEFPDGPGLVLALARGLGYDAITEMLDATVRRTLYALAGTLEDRKEGLRDTIRDILLDSDVTLVRDWLPQDLKTALVQSGLDLIGQARIGFLRDGSDVSAVVEIPWLRADVGASLCQGLARPGLHTSVFYLPWLIIAGIFACCSMPRVSIGVVVAGLLLSTGPVFEPACGLVSPSMVDVPPLRIERNTSSLQQYGLPESFGVNTSFDGDAFRVFTDWLSEPKLKQVVEELAVGQGIDGMTLTGLNLDFALHGYQVEIFPSTSATAEVDLAVIKAKRDAELPPERHECTCLRKIFSFCPFKKHLCFYRAKMFFSGTVQTSALDALSVDVNMQHMMSVNVPPKVQGMINAADSRMMVQISSLFDNNTLPLKRQVAAARQPLISLMTLIAEDPRVYERSLIPGEWTAAWQDTVVANIHQTRLFFEEVELPGASGDLEKMVVVKAEVPGVQRGVTSSMCAKAANLGTMPLRFLPFAIIAALLAYKFPRCAIAVAASGLLLTSPQVLQAACDTVAPTILERPQGGLSVSLAEAFPYNVSDFGFPTTVNFQSVFAMGDLMTLTFDPLPKTAFSNLANHAIMYTGLEDPTMIDKDLATDEAGKIYTNARTQLVLSGYQVDFSPRSWVSANSHMLVEN